MTIICPHSNACTRRVSLTASGANLLGEDNKGTTVSTLSAGRLRWAYFPNGFDFYSGMNASARAAFWNMATYFSSVWGTVPTLAMNTVVPYYGTVTVPSPCLQYSIRPALRMFCNKFVCMYKIAEQWPKSFIQLISSRVVVVYCCPLASRTESSCCSIAESCFGCLSFDYMSTSLSHGEYLYHAILFSPYLGRTKITAHYQRRRKAIRSADSNMGIQHVVNQTLGQALFCNGQ